MKCTDKIKSEEQENKTLYKKVKNRKTNPYEKIRTQKKEKGKKKKRKNTEPCLSELLNAIHNYSLFDYLSAYLYQAIYLLK